MNKYTKQLYKEVTEKVIHTGKYRKLNLWSNPNDETTKTFAVNFWKEFRKNISKKGFYEMISDPHWKYVPMYSWYNKSDAKGVLSMLIGYFCQYLSQDMSKASKVLSKGEGIWACLVLRMQGSHSFSKNILGRKLRTTDARVYKRVLPMLTRNTIVKYLKTEKMSNSKRIYLENYANYHSYTDNLYSVSAWNTWSNAYHSSMKVNGSNAKDIISFISENIEEIKKDKGQWFERRLNNYIRIMSSHLDDEEILFLINLEGVSKVIKDRIILSEII